MSHVQFRLRTLFLLTAFAAIALSFILRITVPNIAAVRVNNENLIVIFSDEWCQWMGIAYYDDETGEVVWPHGEPEEFGLLLHDPFIMIPWSMVIGGLFAPLLAGGAGYAIFRQWRRWRTLKEAHSDRC